MLYPDPNRSENPYVTIPEHCKFVLPAIPIPMEDGSDILSNGSARDGIAGRALCLHRGAGAGQ
jgi:hypothetical protein